LTPTRARSQDRDEPLARPARRRRIEGDVMKLRCRSGRRGTAGVALAASVVLGWITSIGCAGKPVPLWAVAGTTMALAISADEPAIGGTGIGYGTTALADSQRGALGVELLRGSTTEALVPVKFVTRVMPDPASPAGLAGKVHHPNIPLTGETNILHQIVALIDLPASLPEGYYTLKVRRYQNASLATLVDQGPYDSLLWQQELYVSPGDGGQYFTPFRGAWGETDVAIPSSTLRELVPSPQLLLTLPLNTAAATIDIGFPDAKIDVEGAIQHGGAGQNSLVSYQLIDSNSVRIHWVNPTADGSSLALVFDNTQSGYQPVLPSEFTYEAGSFYDADGAPIAPGGGFNPIGQIR
jgi:hypothetical protein